MKIICRNCNNSYTKQQAYIREKTYTENGAVWIQTVCKNCHYINNEWEAPSDEVENKIKEPEAQG